MNIRDRKVLVLGGYGLVGTAVCRELLAKGPRELQIHSLRAEESEKAIAELAAEAGGATLTGSSGDLFGLVDAAATPRERIRSQLSPLGDGDLDSFLLYRVLAEAKADIVVDCINTATGIAYRDIFRTANKVLSQLEGDDAVDPETAEQLLDALYMPRLIRHIQVLYRGLIDSSAKVYIKVGTSGTGGMGLNIPYTHSEEKPSRVLLSKSALAGAHTMLLFLMARTPGAPITKEIKPAAAIAWKRIAHGPIYRGREAIRKVDARPRDIGATFSTVDPNAAILRDEPLETVFIDTGENGVFSLEEFSTLTTAEQMEFVTPEEIARYLVMEIEGGNTGYDVVNAFDNAVLGPTYRAGLLRHWALERMIELEREHGTWSVAFEMLGPPRNSKLLFEAHLLRLAFSTMGAVRQATPEQVRNALDHLVRSRPEVGNDVVAIGIPILFDNGEILRGPKVIVPADAREEAVSPEKLEGWIHDGWVDLRLANCAKWIERFRAITEEVQKIPADDTSSRYVRTSRFWNESVGIQPGKIVGWLLSAEEKGWRIKS